MHQTLDVFGDRAAFDDNVLTRLDPRVKLVLALAGVVAVLCAHHVLLPLAVFAMCMAALVAVHTSPRVLVVRVAGPVGVAAMLFLLQTLLARPTADSEHLWQWPLWSWTITVTREGLDRGLLMGARVLGTMSILVLLGTVTPAFKVFAALRWARVPRTMTDLAMLMYRCTFTLLDQVLQVRSAQRVRLGFVDARRAFASTGRVMGTVILRAMDQADRTHDAMLVRLYGGRLPMADLDPLSRGQWVILAAGLAAAGACMALCMGGVL